MVDIMDRRVTRSLSNELQARAAAAQQGASNSYIVQNSYHANAHVHQQLHHNNSVGQGHHHQQQQHQEHSSGGMSHHQHQHHHPQQQQSLVGMSGGMGVGAGATFPRTTSDEMWNTLMNTPLSPGTPAMEAASLGFLENLQAQPAVPQTMRGNSEELFNSWIATTTPETSNQNQNNVYSGPSSSGNRPRQNSRRMSSELQAIISQQNGTPWAPRADNVEQAYLHTTSYLSDDIMPNVNSDQKSYRTNHPEDKPGPVDYNTSNTLKSMWFSATSPMTRSRSSELRRRYAELEGLPSPPSADVVQKMATQGTLEGLVNPSITSMGNFARGIPSIENNERHINNPDAKLIGAQGPGVPTLPSPAPGHDKQRIQEQPAIATNPLSDVVGLLKGSLERKKLQTKQQQQQQQQQAIPQQQQESQQGMRSMLTREQQQGSRGMPTKEQQQGLRGMPIQEQQQGMRGRPIPMDSPQVSARHEESLNRPQDHRQHSHGDNGLIQSGQVQQLSLLRAHSPEESSCGAPAHSAGIATSDGPSNSAMSTHRQALKRASGSGAVDQPSPKRQAFSGIDSGLSNGDNYDSGGTTKSDILKKPDQLTRAGSITSSLRPGFQLSEIDGATRKRRVERQRKMAEAKGRGNAPPMPPDMQAAVKRCDTLEKEVRSLKLNLSFMNRKDSEQTKKIEELEQQNEDLREEKERLLEELDRVFAVHDQQ